MKKFFYIFALCVFGTMLCGVAYAEDPPPFFLEWGSPGSGPSQFHDAWAIASDASGDVYVADMLNHRIQKFTWDGQFLLSWGTEGSGNGQFRSPSGVCVGSDGFVYVADLNNQRIQKFTREGTYILQFGNSPSDPIQLWAPYGIAMGPDGNIYISSSTQAILKYSPGGTYITHWVFTGNNVGLTVDRNCLVYVSESNADHMFVFDCEGNPLTDWSTIDGAYSLASDAQNNIFVAGYGGGNPSLAKYTSNGGLLCAWDMEGDGSTTGIGLGRDGLVYAVDAYLEKVQVFGDLPIPTRLETWGSLKSLYR